MEDFTIRLYDLLDSKSFDELTAAELAFVLKHMTEWEYRSHARIHAASSALEYKIPVPLPLAFPASKPVFWKRPVPVYQAFAGAACIALLVFLLLPRGKNGTTIHFASVPVDSVRPVLSVTGGNDTLVRLVEVVRFREKLIRDTVTILKSVYSSYQPEKRMLEAGTINYPSAAQFPERNLGIPLSEDRTAALLPATPNSGVFEIGR